MDERFESILLKLKGHIIQMESLDDWLFVAVNTMKAIVDNSCKDDAALVLKAAECSVLLLSELPGGKISCD